VRAAWPLVVVAAVAGCKETGSARPGASDEGATAPVGPTAAPTPPGDPDDPSPVVLPPAPEVPPAPRGLPPTPSPEHNPTTPEKVALGALLFFDPRLGGGEMACASCHLPAHGWADGRVRSTTASGKDNLRHTPGLWNAAYARQWYWDGSMPNLEALVLSNWRGQLAADPPRVAAALDEVPLYHAHFARAFGGAPSAERVAEALAAFVRTLRSGDSPWDRHEAGVLGAVSPVAIAGAQVFNVRAGCARCHVAPLYTDGGFHSRVASDAIDPGRMRVTAAPADRGAFRTPTLRGALHTAPYFHDGSAPSLEDAIEAELARDGVVLSIEERVQLQAFVEALSPPLEAVAVPELP
jgi:cytochrome c peroxidase